MATAYQYDASGYFAGALDDHGGPLPNNATRMAPQEKQGTIPRWDGKAWQQAENHKGKEGFVNGAPFTVTAYGPLPEGWSQTPPAPTKEELASQRRETILARLAEIDKASLRPLRAVTEGAATQEDTDRLAVLEKEAVSLRMEMAELN